VRLASHDTFILGELEAHREAWAHTGFVYRSGADLLLQHGEHYRGCPLPPSVAPGRPGLCFRDAAELALEREGLRYVEGVITDGIGVVNHAWLIDPDGTVIDPALATVADTPEEFSRFAYLGAIFRPELVLEYAARLGVHSAPLLDRIGPDLQPEMPAGTAGLADYRSDWPILRVPYDPTRATLAP